MPRKNRIEPEGKTTAMGDRKNASNSTAINPADPPIDASNAPRGTATVLILIRALVFLWTLEDASYDHEFYVSTVCARISEGTGKVQEGRVQWRKKVIIGVLLGVFVVAIGAALLVFHYL